MAPVGRLRFLLRTAKLLFRQLQTPDVRGFRTPPRLLREPPLRHQRSENEKARRREAEEGLKNEKSLRERCARLGEQAVAASHRKHRDEAHEEGSTGRAPLLEAQCGPHEKRHQERREREVAPLEDQKGHRRDEQRQGGSLREPAPAVCGSSDRKSPPREQQGATTTIPTASPSHQAAQVNRNRSG